MLNHFAHTTRNLFLLVLLATPAWAQTEIDPDHFPDEASQTNSASNPELQAQIQDLQARVEGYEAQLRAKSEVVEEARQEAISAGIQGDGAGCYIEAYRQQQKQLESLQQSFAAQIAAARNTIASLQAQGRLLAAERVSGKTRAVAKDTAAPFLLSSRRSSRPPNSHR